MTFKFKWGRIFFWEVQTVFGIEIKDDWFIEFLRWPITFGFEEMYYDGWWRSFGFLGLFHVSWGPRFDKPCWPRCSCKVED